MYPSREFLEQWSRENPKQAIAVLLFGACMIGLTIWIAVTGP